MEIIFDLSSGKIMVATSSIDFTLPATSGRGACENSGSKSCLLAPFEGPIPIGMYFIDPKDLSDPNLIGDVARNYRPDSPGNWGDFRVRLQPLSTTNTHGSDGFFLHGGSYSGSAGCIDVGGGLSGNSRTDLLKIAIKASPGNIFLEVIP